MGAEGMPGPAGEVCAPAGRSRATSRTGELGDPELSAPRHERDRSAAAGGALARRDRGQTGPVADRPRRIVEGEAFGAPVPGRWPGNHPPEAGETPPTRRSGPWFPCTNCGGVRPYEPEDLRQDPDGWAVLPAGQWPCPTCGADGEVRY